MGSSAQERVNKVQGQLQDKLDGEIRKDADQVEALLAQSDDLMDRTAAAFQKKTKKKTKTESAATDKTSLLSSKIPGVGGEGGGGEGGSKIIVICALAAVAVAVILGKWLMS